MRRIHLKGAIIILAVFFLVGGTIGLAQDEMCVPMGDITLAPLADKPLRSQVDFPHALHFAYKCQECHHTWNGQGLITGCTASGCHDLNKSPVTSSGKPVSDPVQLIRYYKNAYHQKCIGCHKEIAAHNKKLEVARIGSQTISPTGPTGCKECHPQ